MWSNLESFTLELFRIIQSIVIDKSFALTLTGSDATNAPRPTRQPLMYSEATSDVPACSSAFFPSSPSVWSGPFQCVEQLFKLFVLLGGALYVSY